MALSHTTKVFAIKQAKIYKVTADTSGASTTYGSGVQLVGARELIVTETWKEAYLRGDNVLLDYESARDTVKLTVRHGKLNFDAVSILTGSTVVDSGSTPNQKVTNTYATADVPAFFKIDAVCVAVDGMATTTGDYHVIAGKCKIGGSRAFGLKEEDFEEFQFDCVAVPPIGNGSVWYQDVLEETAALPS